MYPYKFVFDNSDNENIEPVSVHDDSKNSIIYGIVENVNKHPIKNAVVRVSALKDSDEQHLAFVVTDDDGEFVYGPVDDHESIVVKVWVEKVKVKKLTITPKD
jgi:hypothetical protein